MGMANSPAVFQRGMNEVLAGLINICCICYVDDILIFSPTWEKHLDNLRAVFERLRAARLFVKPTKGPYDPILYGMRIAIKRSNISRRR